MQLLKKLKLIQLLKQLLPSNYFIELVKKGSALHSFFHLNYFYDLL